MKYNASTLWLGRILALLLVAGLVALVFFAPLIAVVIFVALVMLLAIAKGKTEGFWSGVRLFVREILFGLSSSMTILWPNMRSTEGRPRGAAWKLGNCGGAAIGELIVNY